jgi:hypothetical protein
LAPATAEPAAARGTIVSVTSTHPERHVMWVTVQGTGAPVSAPWGVSWCWCGTPANLEQCEATSTLICKTQL